MPPASTTNVSEPQTLISQHEAGIQQVPQTRVTPQTPQTPQQIQSHIQQLQQVAAFRIDGGLLDKRATHLLLQPRFLSPNSMLGARFPFVPNFPQPQSAPEEMLDTAEQRDEEQKKSYSCHTCQKGFSSKQYLKKHEMVHYTALTLDMFLLWQEF